MAMGNGSLSLICQCRSVYGLFPPAEFPENLNESSIRSLNASSESMNDIFNSMGWVRYTIFLTAILSFLVSSPRLLT
jgi:hypothetical protein